LENTNPSDLKLLIQKLKIADDALLVDLEKEYITALKKICHKEKVDSHNLAFPFVEPQDSNKPDQPRENFSITPDQVEQRLLENNPEEYLKRYLVLPTLELLKQGKKGYDDLVKIGNRTPEQMTKLENDFNSFGISEAMEKAYDLGAGKNNHWYHYINKNREPKAKREIRLYLSVKSDQIILLVKNLAENLINHPCLREIKINIDWVERLDNLVIYFSENAKTNDIQAVIKALEETKTPDVSIDDLFNTWDIPTIFGEKISVKDNQGKDKTIGSIIFNPIRSSSELVRVNGNYSHGGGIGTHEVTPNSLLSTIQSEIMDLAKIHNLNYDKIIKDLMQIKLEIKNNRPEDAGEKSLIDYLKMCKQEIDKIL
jgi:hypothetical protein